MLAAGLTLGLSLLGTVTQAQLPMNESTNAPFPGYYDQSFLPTTLAVKTTTSFGNDADSYLAYDRGSHGQTFATGSYPGGYNLNSLTVRQIQFSTGNGGTYRNFPNGATVLFRYGTISGSTLTPILTTNATYTGPTIASAGASGTGDYFTFDLSGAGITLAPNTNYFVEVATTSGWYVELFNKLNPTTFTNGTSFTGDDAAALDADLNVTLTAGEFAFDANLSPVGAPSVVAVISPSSATNGQSVTVTATVTPGSGTVTNVSVDLTPIGGSVTPLVLSSGSVYTNTFIVPGPAAVGTYNLVVTAIDTTPLLAQSGPSLTVYVGNPPTETANITPTGNTTTELGLAFKYTASFTGSAPLAYQWQFSPDDSTYTNIDSAGNPTATNSVLVLYPTTTDNSGYYQVVVTNAYGSTTSSDRPGLLVSGTAQYGWQLPVSMSTLTANQILTNFPNTKIAGALVAKNGGNPIIVTNSGSDTPITFSGNGAWATLSGGSGYNNNAAPPTTGNANFDTVLGDYYFDGTTHNITLRGLVVGQQYSVQLFALDDRSGDTARTANFQDPADASDITTTFTMGENNYVVGTFTAQSSVQVIQENLPFTGGVGNFNGMVLRAVGWNPPPYFTTQPPVLTNLYGGVNMSLLAVAAGDATVPSPTITYQWKAGPPGGPYTNLVESAKYVGTTTTNLTVTTLTANDAVPVYVLAASNGGGTTLSRPTAVTIIILTPATPGSSMAYMLSNGPAGFWPLNDAGDPSGGTLLALDYSGNNHHGTYGATAQTVNGFGILSPQPPGFPGFDVGQGALQLAATDTNAVVLLPVLNLPSFVTNRSFAMWIHPNSEPPGAAGLLMNRNGTDTYGFSFADSQQGTDINGQTARALAYHANGDNANAWNWNSSLYPPIGTWSFIALVVNPSNAIAYVFCQGTNGVYYQMSATNNVSPEFGGFFNGGTTTIGNDPQANNTARVFPGIISDVGIWNSSLNASNLTRMYQAGVGVAGFPAQITAQPQSAFSSLGSPAKFSAGVGGTAPIYFQWQFNSVNLTNGVGFTGVNSGTLSISSVSAAYVGNYDLIVSNLFGGYVTSSIASLSLQSPAMVGQWFNGTSTNLNDESGFSPAGTHDLYAVGAGNFMFTNDVPPNQPSTNLSLFFYNGDTAFSVSNSSVLDAGYTNTYDDRLQGNMTVLFWARGFPGQWRYWVSKNGDSGSPNSGWTLRENGANGKLNTAGFTVRETGSPGIATLGSSGDDMGSFFPSNDGQWHQYAGTFSALTGVRSLYVDGLLAAQQTNNISYNLATLEHLVIGGIDASPGNTFGSYLTGEIYNVQIYNYVVDLTTNIQAQVGNLPPSIEGQPPTNITAFATFQTQINPTAVVGSLPLSYQWQLNHTNLPENANFIGTTSNILTINVDADDAGVYNLVVTNLYGMTVSSNTILTVVPASLLGQWFTNNTLADVSGYSPAGIHDGYAVGSTGFAFTNDVPGYRQGKALILNAGNTGIAISNSSSLDAGYTNTFDDTMHNAFTVAFWAKGYPNQWNKFVSKNGDSGSPNAGWCVRDEGDNSHAGLTMRSPGGTVTLGSAVFGNSDDNRGTIGSKDGAWHHYAGVYNISTGIRSFYVDGVLSGNETGNGAYNLAAYSHLVIGARDNSPGNTFGDYMPTGSRLYDVRVYNYPLSSNAVAALVAIPAGVPPTILAQPTAPRNTYVGYTVNLTVNAGGSATMTNQWTFNGTNLVDGTYDSATVSGSLTTNLTIVNVTTNFTGVYALYMTNGFGRTNSISVSLTVSPLSSLEFAGSYAAAIAALNPAGFWPLNDLGNPAAGTVTALDVSGNGLNGTYGATSIDSFNGALSPQPPVYPGFATNQGALGTFRGVNSSVVTLPGLNLNTNAVTFALWVFPTNNVPVSSGLLFNRNGTDSADGFCFSGTTSGGTAGLGYTWDQNDANTWGYNSALYPQVNVWNYVAMVVTATNATFYLYYKDSGGVYHEGTAVHTYPEQVETFNSSGSIQIGGDISANNRTFPGRISEAAVLKQSLTGSQMTNLYLNAVGLVGGFPAQIATQPVNANAFAGASAVATNSTQTVQFTVGAVGDGPLSYQWSFGGNPLTNNANYTGVTSNRLTITIPPNTATNFAGNYSVLVTNAFASTNSVNAALVMVTLPAPPAAALVGEWLKGAANFHDVSGYQPTNRHDGYIVSSANPTLWAFTNDAPPGFTGVSFWTLTNTLGLSISNSSTLDAQYTNTFDAITNQFTVTFWARGFAGQWNPFVSKFGEGEAGWQLRDLGSVAVGGFFPTNFGAPAFTVRDNNAGGLALGSAGGDDMGTNRQVADGQWHFYAGSFNAYTGNRTLYLDGVAIAKETNNAACIPAASAHLAILAKDSPPGNSFSSFSALEIYDVRIYSYELTSSQVSQVQNPVPTTPTLSTMQVTGSQFSLSWSVGTLQSATNVAGPYLPVLGATSPYTNTINQATPNLFFRVSNP